MHTGSNDLEAVSKSEENDTGMNALPPAFDLDGRLLVTEPSVPKSSGRSLDELSRASVPSNCD